MFKSSPRETEWVSWLFFALWSLVIFVTIPIARTLQGFVEQHLGRQTFTYVVIAVVTLVAVGAILDRLRLSVSTGSSVWLAIIAMIFIGYTIRLSAAPAEAVHFLEYGVLGLLIYRALTHRVKDVSIYFMALMIGAMVGMLDEAIQWVTPKRFWGLNDIWLNFFAVGLTQVAIAKGFRPSIVSGRPGALNVQRLCLLTTVAVLLLAASLLNTPTRIAWYAQRIPILEFLMTNESAMFEYGYFYGDPEIGSFTSRLSPQELSQNDEDFAEASAAILNQYRSDSAYADFLEKYTPVSNPFVHEARVHLFRRDRHIQRAEEEEVDEETYREYIAIVYRENLIMEKYFTQTFSRSDYVLLPDKIAFFRENQAPDYPFTSRVSYDLITEITERQLMVGLTLILFGLAIVYWHFGKKRGVQSV